MARVPQTSLDDPFADAGCRKLAMLVRPRRPDPPAQRKNGLSRICQFGLRVAAVFLRRAAIRGAAAYRETLGFLCFFMVLPVGIEPTTSPLPRECSTTELRQRRCGTGPARSCKHIHDDPATGKASGRSATRTVASRVTFSAGSSHSLTGPALSRCIAKWAAILP